MSDFDKRANRDYSQFDAMSTDALKEILYQDSLLPDDDETDMDAILYIMEVLARREKDDPTHYFMPVDAAWEQFKESYLPSANDGKSLYDLDEEAALASEPDAFAAKPLPHRRGLIRTALAAAVIIAVLLIGTVTASAFGYNLWGSFAQWTRDTFGFNEASEPADDISKMQNPLAEYGVTEKLMPAWFPAGYEFNKVDVAETPTRTTFHIEYLSADGEILITISMLSEPTTSTYEKDGSDVVAYKAGEIEHYIITNNDNTSIVWAQSNYECSITGKLSRSDVEKMIDSIYSGDR